MFFQTKSHEHQSSFSYGPFSEGQKLLFGDIGRDPLPKRVRPAASHSRGGHRSRRGHQADDDFLTALRGQTLGTLKGNVAAYSLSSSLPFPLSLSLPPVPGFFFEHGSKQACWQFQNLPTAKFKNRSIKGTQDQNQPKSANT